MPERDATTVRTISFVICRCEAVVAFRGPGIEDAIAHGDFSAASAASAFFGPGALHTLAGVLWVMLQIAAR